MRKDATETRLSFEQQLSNLRAETRLIASGDRYGLLVTGPGGTSKSWTCNDTLRKSKAPVAAPGNGHITPQGLYTFLYDNSGKVVVLDDCVSLTDKRLLGILKAATAGSTVRGKMVRTVSWSTGVAGALALLKAGYPTTFVFTGSIIILTNSTPAVSTDWEAALSRFTPCSVTPTDEELRAFGARISKKGYTLPKGRLNASGCKQVRNVLAEKACPNLRVVVRGFAARRAIPTSSIWKPLVQASVAGFAEPAALTFVRELLTKKLTPGERRKAFIDAGHGKKSYYHELLKLAQATPLNGAGPHKPAKASAATAAVRAQIRAGRAA